MSVATFSVSIAALVAALAAPVAAGDSSVCRQERHMADSDGGKTTVIRTGSGNTATIVREALTARVKLKEDGRTRSMSKLEVSMAQLANKAAGGDLKAIAMVISLYREIEADAANRSHDKPLDRADREILDMLLERVRAAADGNGDGQ